MRREAAMECVERREPEMRPEGVAAAGGVGWLDEARHRQGGDGKMQTPKRRKVLSGGQWRSFHFSWEREKADEPIYNATSCHAGRSPRGSRYHRAACATGIRRRGRGAA